MKTERNFIPATAAPFAGLRAVVTGGTSRLGRALAEQLSDRAPDPAGESVGNFDVSSDAGKRLEASNSNSDERDVGPQRTGS